MQVDVMLVVRLVPLYVLFKLPLKAYKKKLVIPYL